MVISLTSKNGEDHFHSEGQKYRNDRNSWIKTKHWGGHCSSHSLLKRRTFRGISPLGSFSKNVHRSTNPANALFMRELYMYLEMWWYWLFGVLRRIEISSHVNPWSPYYENGFTRSIIQLLDHLNHSLM